MSIMDQSWVKVQQKAFTRWCNAHLGKRGLKLENMQTDFKSGINLLQLLEVIGEHTFGRYNKKPRMEIQMRENLQIALKFIEERGVKLTAIGAGDIFEGNLKLILGMIWTVILRFAIAEISVEELTAKEALLLWCQRKTADYDNVDIKEFTWSWQDGLGFCALIHKHRPDLIDYESLDPKNKEENLNLAFDIAENELGLPKFLDAEDMIDVKPDERAVMTYLAEYFKYFSKGQKAENAGRRISKVAALTKEIEEMKESYENKAGPLKEWIDKKIVEIPDYEFDNTLEGVEKLIDELKDFKNNEKPPKLQEKTEVATALNNLKIKISNNKRPAYNPPEELTTESIDKAWNEMEDKEKERTMEMQKEYARQKKLKSLVEEFYRRVKALESWAEKKEEYLNTKEQIDTLPLAKTNLKVLEAYNTEYELSKNKLNPTIDLGQEIIDMGYKGKDEIQQKMDELNKRWEDMSGLENSKKQWLEEELAREMKKEELRKEFAEKAREYNRWHKDQMGLAQDHIFGDDLESVTEFKTKLDETTDEITTKSTEKKEKMEDLDKQLTELGSTDNKYSALTIDDIKNKHDLLMNALNERNEAYEKELNRQTIMENKRKEFAQVANEFGEFLDKIRKDINNLSGEPEDMISGIENIYQEGKEIDEKLEQAEKIDTEQKELEIRSNRHTEHTYSSLKSDAEELKEWSEKKLEHWKHEKVKKDKRQEFADLANDFGPFLDKIRKDINEVSGEPEDMISGIENIYQEGKEIDEKLEQLTPINEECKNLRTGANPYTKYTYNQLEDTAGELKKFSEKLINFWKQEKVKKDQRKKFAQVADKYSEFLDKIRQDINNLSGEPEDMISGIENIYQEGKEIDEKLEELSNEETQNQELDIYSNKFTKHSFISLKNEAEELKKWSEKKLEHWKHEKVKKDKRQEFADLANDYGPFLDEFIKELGSIEGEPDDKTQQINDKYQEGKEIDEKLEELKKVDQECVDLRTGTNPYTKYSFSMLVNKTKQLHQFVTNLLNSAQEDKELNQKNIQQEKESQEAERIENLRLEYFEKAQGLNQWIDNFTELLKAPIIAESSKEVKELMEKYESFVNELEGQAEVLNKITEMSGELTEAGVENFLGLPIDGIKTAWEEMNELVGGKKTQLDEELAVQEKNEELCEKFATGAEELQNFLKKQQEVVAEQLSGELSEQTKTVQNQLNEVAGKRSDLNDLIQLDNEIAERNIDNKSTVTASDLKSLFDTVLDAFNKKIKAIEQEILVKEGSKVTQEQLDEFKQLFELFDKDKKGALFPYEFSGVLNTLGDDLDEDEMKKVFDKYDEDKSGTIEFNEFVEFMTSRVQDADTLEQSLESWKVIAKDKEFVTLQDMQMAGMRKEDIEYITSNMEPLEDGFDYKGWCNKVYGQN
ncbi:alpha-actinin [Anaeramoeba flamelloides]|uniref:Alpha-actinin n=1 Tax=Anaeramoeba flamelloides TaxID=1746091 RepID=A0ABQ8YCY9_9EUKA|nr:alpha-actinin [Anaeramoeba flamelloides]